MKTKITSAITILGLFTAGCAQNYVASPIQGSDQQVRYTQGIPTTLSDKQQGSVQLTAMGYLSNDNRLIFGAAAFNKGTASANFGIENVSIVSNGVSMHAYSRDELAHEAKVKAGVAILLTALAGAGAAYSANQAAYSHTNGTIITPRGGMITYHETTYDPAVAAIGTAAAAGATAYGISSIENSLDRTLSSLNGSILQTNTIDPGQSAGGEIVVDLPKGKAYPKNLDITVHWNGEDYVFQFDVNKSKG